MRYDLRLFVTPHAPHSRGHKYALGECSSLSTKFLGCRCHNQSSHDTC